MTIRQRRIPSYRLHKPTGQAVVRLDGRDHYLGKHGSEASHEKYHRLIAEWLASGQHRVPSAESRTPDVTINEMILAFLRFAEKHYRHADGTPTGEFDNLRHALRPLRELYGSTPVRTFGPLALRAVQQEMIRAGLCRTTINARIRRIRHAFKWATSVELIPTPVAQALATVPPLLRGRCDAPESVGVQPVDWSVVDATLPHLTRPVAAMVQVMRYSNCRAEDVVIMRGQDLIKKGELLEYRPAHHKNAWREAACPSHQRVILMGARCQDVLRPFLHRDRAAFVFSPRDALAEHVARRGLLRKTRPTPSELRKRKALPTCVPGERYTVNTFQQAVRRACRRAQVQAWSVLQVRHTRGTEVRERYGLEGAAASLGNTIEAAQIYAERNRELARRIACELG